MMEMRKAVGESHDWEGGISYLDLKPWDIGEEM